jgi:DNA replication ATP-dependent helicase Dna2
MHIDRGLLYYLQSDQTQVNSDKTTQAFSQTFKVIEWYLPSIKGIVVRRSDLVGLIMRRNELANDILKASTVQQLPPMIQV